MIIGGGVAGVSAAIHLWDKANLTLCEASSKLGGRINSKIDKKTGDSIDNGQHLLIGAYSRFLEMLKLTNSLDKLEIQEKFFIKYYINNGSFAIDGTKLPGDLGLILGLLNLPVPIREKLNALKFIAKIKIGILKINNYSCYELLEKNKQTGKIYKIFWEPIILATLNIEPEIASAELFVNVLKMGFFAGGENKKLIFPKVGLSELLVRTIGFLQERIDLKLKTTVTDIKIDHQNIYAKIKSEFRQFDRMILALPVHRAAMLLNNNSLDALSKNLSSSSIISIYLWFDKQFFPDKFATFIGTKIQWVFNKRKLGFSAGKNLFPEYLSITISSADKLIKHSSDEIVDMCLKELQNIFPRSKKAKLLHSKVIKEKFATFRASVDNQEIRKKIPKLHPKIELIGDWTYSPFPSTIEGAARSGVINLKEIK